VYLVNNICLNRPVLMISISASSASLRQYSQHRWRSDSSTQAQTLR
jgi:hypothetical protein